MMGRQAFSSLECEEIVKAFTNTLKREEHTVDHTLQRVNRRDVGGKLAQKGDIDWILERVLDALPQLRLVVHGATAVAFRGALEEDFPMMHEVCPHHT